MELWFSDPHTDNVKLSVKVDKQLFGEETDFQKIAVFESQEFGRFITSDGHIVFSEKDEFVYDEMIVHVPMAVHPRVRKVLVIGGGDGGVARELSYYKEVKQIDVVEPDQMFVYACRQFFPDNARGLEDERVNIYYEDGLRFLRTRSPAGPCTTRPARAFPSAGYIRPTFPPALPGTGCLDLFPKNITR
mgnify:CR=1 FL=1